MQIFNMSYTRWWSMEQYRIHMCLFFLLSCLTFPPPSPATGMFVPTWDTPEFQLLVDWSTGCRITAVFEDPSDSTSIIAWCEGISPDAAYTITRIRFEQGSTQNISMTPIWIPPQGNYFPNVAVNAKGDIWSPSPSGIVRLTPNPSNSSAMYDQYLVWNSTMNSASEGISIDLGSNDVYFLASLDSNGTNQACKLSQGMPPAVPIRALDPCIPTSLRVHQATHELFVVCENATVVIYSPTTDSVRVFANFPPYLPAVDGFTSFLPSPDGSIVWIAYSPETSDPSSPLLVVLHDSSEQADIVVAVADCLNAPTGSAIRYDDYAQMLFFTCGDQVMSLQLDSSYTVISTRILTDARCLAADAPVQLRWNDRPLPLMFLCSSDVLIASSGNSITAPVSPLDCSSPNLLSSFPNSSNQTVLLLMCAGVPAVLIEGVTYPLNQLSMDSNGVAHLPNTDLIYCSCNYPVAGKKNTRLVEFNMRTQQLKELAKCANPTADYNSLSKVSELNLAVTNVSVSYSCIDSLWRLDLMSNLPSPVMILNLTVTDTQFNQTELMSIYEVRSVNSTTIVKAFDYLGSTLLLLSPSGGIRRVDEPSCQVSDFQLASDGSSIIFNCLDNASGYSQLRSFDLLTNHCKILHQESTVLRFSADPRPAGTSLIVAWPNATSFVVMDSNGQQLAWHKFPLDCIAEGPRESMVLFSNDIAILNCESLAATISLLTAPISALINSSVSQPFIPLLFHSRAVCYGQAFSGMQTAVIDDTLLYLQCDSALLAFTNNFRCAPGQTWIYGSCTPCAPATFKPEARFNVSLPMMDRCESCPPGTATLVAGSFICTKCELGSTPDDHSLTCQVCPLGSYTPTIGWSCVLCNGKNQVGLNCANGLAIVQEGYFAYLVQSDDSVPIYETAICLRGLCPGGPLQLATKNGDTIDGTIQYCAEPRLNSPSNLLCGACDSALGYVEWGTSCVRCAGVDVGMVFALVAFAIVVVAWLLVSSASRRSTTSGHIALLLYFVQTALIQLDPFPEWIQFMHVVNFSTSSVGRCIAPISPVQQTILSLATPAILLAILACFAVMQFTCQYCTVGSDHGKRVDSAALKRFSSPLVANDGGTEPDYNYDMDDSHEVAQDRQSSVSISSSSSFATRWGPLYRGYSSRSARYWTAIVLLRRSVLAVISIYLANPEQFAYRQVAFVLIHFISYQLHIRAQPYATPALNTADGISYSLLLILGCLQVMVGGNSQPPVWMQVTVVSMVMIPTLLMIVWIGMVQWSGRRRSNSRPFDPSGSIDDVTNDNSAVPSSSNFLSRSWHQFRTSFELNRYVAGAVSVLLFCYTGVIQTAFAFLRCVPVGSASLVFSAPTIDCHSQTYQHASVGVILVLIVMGFGFPIASLVLLTLNRARIEASTVRDGNSSSARSL